MWNSVIHILHLRLLIPLHFGDQIQIDFGLVCARTVDLLEEGILWSWASFIIWVASGVVAFPRSGYLRGFKGFALALRWIVQLFVRAQPYFKSLKLTFSLKVKLSVIGLIILSLLLKVMLWDCFVKVSLSDFIMLPNLCVFQETAVSIQKQRTKF